MFIARQGDVLIRQVKVLPSKAKEVDNTKLGRIVLAYGEVTGHAHAIAMDEAVEYTMNDAAGIVSRFIKSLGAHKADTFNVLERIQGIGGEMLLLNTPVGPTLFAATDVEDAISVATPKDNFSRLVHEEHRAHGLLIGIYGVNAVQREYHPEAIRNVAD